LVAAAGNSNSDIPYFPASYTSVIAVASVDSADQRSPYSNYGDWVDVAAPGGPVWTVKANGDYGYSAGTSMAAPKVSGLAALIFSNIGSIGVTGTSSTGGSGGGKKGGGGSTSGESINTKVRSCIENNTDNIGISGIGRGRINAFKAVLCAQ
jgi:thermitase